MEEDIYKTLPVPATSGLTQKSQALASPQTSVDKQQAAKAQTFAYSPDQARQGLDIGVARRDEEAQRTYKVLQNQQTQATLQEIKRVEQQIADERQKAEVARGQAAQARGQVNSINSQIAAIQAQIAEANQQAERARQAAAVVVPQAATPQEPAQAFQRGAPGPGSPEEAASILKASNPNYVPIGMRGVYIKADGMAVRSDDGLTWYQADGRNQRVPGGATGKSY